MKKFFLVTGILSIVVGYGYWLLYGNTPMMAPDSMSYITFSPSRTPAYPIFLFLSKTIFGDYSIVPILQLILLLSGVTYLVCQFYHLSRSAFWSMALWLLLAGNLEMIKYAFLILTEALTITLLLLCLGLLCRFIITGATRYLGLISALLGVAILIRPASYGWVLGLLFAGIGAKAYLSQLRYRYIVSIISIPLLICLLLGSVFNHYRHGFFSTQSFLGEMLIGKTGILAEENIPSNNARAMKILADYSRPVRSLLQVAPTLRIEYLLSSVYADQYRYSPFAQQVSKTMLESANKTTPELDKERTKLAIEVIMERPIEYARYVLLHYAALWQVWDLGTPLEVQQMNHFLSKSTPLPGNLEYPEYPRQAAYKKGSWIAIPLRLALIWVFCITVYAPLMLLIQLYRGQVISEFLCLASVSAGFVQGAYLLTALIQSGIPRFFLVMWPAIALIGVSSLWYIFNIVYKHK
jgi:hypothetical protein